MKDPIVAEIRQHRMEHTKVFNSDLKLICEDLRKVEKSLGERVIQAVPPRLRPTSEPGTPSEET